MTSLLPNPPFSAISSPFNPSFPAHSTRARCSGLRGSLRGWSDWEQRMVRGERWEALCSLLLAPREGEVEGGGSCLWKCGGGGVSPRAAQPLLSSVTPSTGTVSLSLSFSFCSSLSQFLLSSVSHHTPTYRHRRSPLLLSLSLALCMPFPSLLSSACRHTFTCCMSPCGNPACHLSIYLKETRFNLLMAERGIY